MAGLEYIDPNGARGFAPLHCPRFVIGRGSECDLVLADAWASRRHVAIVLCADGSHEMQDLGSGNGTKWNDEVHGSHVIIDGDVLRVGRTSLTYRMADLAEPPVGPSTQHLPSAQEHIDRLQSECEILRSLLEKRASGRPEDPTLLQSGLSRMNPQADLLFPSFVGGAPAKLWESSAWAHFGIGTDALAFGEALLNLGHKRLVIFVDEMLPDSRARLRSPWLCRLHGEDGVLQGLRSAIGEAQPKILELAAGEEAATDLFLITGGDVSNNGSELISAVSSLSVDLEAADLTRATRLHCIVMRDSPVEESDKDLFAPLMQGGRLSSVLFFQESRCWSDDSEGASCAAAGALDLLRWLPRMEACEGGIGDGGLASHMATGGFAALGLSGTLDGSSQSLEEMAAAVLTDGFMVEGFSTAMALSAIVVALVGQEDLRADPDLIQRVRASLRSLESQLPQARVSRAIYVVSNPGIRLFVALFGLT